PSGTRISEITPLTGDGTSESTLSVDTSNSGSSSATCSPTCLNHLVIVPSVTVSPSWGIWMSAIGFGLRSSGLCGVVMMGAGSVQAPAGQVQDRLTEELRQRRVRLDELGDLVD